MCSRPVGGGQKATCPPTQPHTHNGGPQGPPSWQPPIAEHGWGLPTTASASLAAGEHHTALRGAGKDSTP